MDRIYYVNVPDKTTVNLRDRPDRYDSLVIARVPHGTAVIYNYTMSSFGNVTVDGYGTGYIDLGYLSVVKPEDGDSGGGTGWVDRYGSTTWRKSSHGNTFYSAVVNLQKDLRKVGYTSITNADGYYGTITETAVKNFQGNNGLTKDGICGDKTKQKLWDHPDRV